MWETVYKVVLTYLRDKEDKSNERIISAFTDNNFSVEYMLGKRALPMLEGSFLFAFEDLPSASQYLGSASGSVLSQDAVLRVYACDAEVVHAPAVATDGNIERFWSEHWYEFDPGWPYVVEPPEGTVWCRWLCPKELALTDGRVLRVPKKTVRGNVSAQRVRYRVRW